MEKSYQPNLCDQKWQKFWKDQNIAKPEVALSKHSKASGKSFTLMMPPPNVTGVLHQGHAIFLAVQDSLVRWHRMLGDETLYLPGSDHASIAVQMQVVKHLSTKGLDYKELGREKFVEACWEWIEDYRPRIYKQVESIGTSCDWSRVRFTLDEGLNDAVNEAFIRMYENGLIYRDEKLVNWTPAGQTVLSDQEVIHEERQGSLWHLKYPLEDGSGHVVVATTRPETMLGDVAVAVNPDDERYKDLVGKNVILPIVNRKIPVIADSFVDKEFGSGVVKITPAHDPNDFECGNRHKLARINVFTKEAKIVEGLGGEADAYAGLDRFVARKKVVENFESKSLLEKIENHTNKIGVSERHKDVVEPFLSKQWFVDVKSMAAKAAKAAESGELEIVPAEFSKHFLHWMNNLHDWCISRQLWWGHPIPAFHNTNTGELHVGRDKPEGDEWIADPDVLDTWFSSGLWPFSTLGWPNKTTDMDKFYPTQVLETGFDILFFWVARMVMMGLELTGKLPFDKVYLHPMVRDEQGRKMSKTLGNVIDPMEIIDEFGADTLRFTLHALCVQGRDLNLSQDRIRGYRNFTNKVWNASKFVMMQECRDDWRATPKAKNLHDQWILEKLNICSVQVNEAWSQFRIQEASDCIYHFIWDDFCDWYLESAKTSRDSSQVVLLHVLGETLKLLHPVCPHITEEIWHHMPGVSDEESISCESFPLGSESVNQNVVDDFNYIKDFIAEVRNVRAELKVKPSDKLNIYVGDVDKISLELLQTNQDVIVSLAKLKTLAFSNIAEGVESKDLVFRSRDAKQSFVAKIPTDNLIDKEAESKRLEQEITGLEKYVKGLEAKLSNENFVSRAPAEVVEKEKAKLSQAKSKMEQASQSLASLGSH